MQFFGDILIPGGMRPLPIQMGETSAPLHNRNGRCHGTTSTTWLNLYTTGKSQLKYAWPVPTIIKLKTLTIAFLKLKTLTIVDLVKFKFRVLMYKIYKNLMSSKILSYVAWYILKSHAHGNPQAGYL